MVPSICVAQVISNLKIGGAQKLLCVFAEQQSHGNLKTKVAVLNSPSPTQYHDELIAAGAEVDFFPGSGMTLLAQIWRLAAWFRRENIAVAHSHLQRSNIISPLAAKMVGIPSICGLHVPDIGPGEKKTWRRYVETAVLTRVSSGIIACSSSVAASHQNRLAPRIVDVSTNPAPYPTTLLSAKQPPKDKTRKTRFLVVGRLAPEKGVDTVLKAAKALTQHTTAFSVTIAGDGECRAALENQCCAIGLGKHVTFIGSVADVATLYRSHDVYLSGSRAEGLSIALLEAMAHGLPVIATPAGDAARLVTAETGYDPAQNDPDAIARAMADLIDAPELRFSLGENGRTRIIENYSPKVWAQDLGRKYLEAIRR